MEASTFILTCADGHRMPVYAWLPPQTPAAIILIAHGMAEYALRYATIASTFTSENFAVYAYDQRGHGYAVAEQSQLGIVKANWFNQQVEDMNLLVRDLKAQYHGKKIFLLGHSMGSFLSQRYFKLHGKEINGLILSATNGKKDPLLGIGINVAFLQAALFGKNFRSHLIDKLSFGKFNSAFKPNRTSHDWLSRNEAEVDQYIKDPFCGFVCSALFFEDFFNGVKDALDHKNIQKIPLNIPVYAFAGDKDQVGGEGKGFLTLIDKWKATGLKDFTHHLYKDGRHEMMNETNRGEVLANIRAWLKKHL